MMAKITQNKLAVLIATIAVSAAFAAFFLPPLAQAASSATLFIKAVVQNASPLSAGIWNASYAMSCSDASGSSCTASYQTQTTGFAPSSESLTNTQNTSTCTYTLARNCIPAGDYYAVANFSGLAFPSGADTTTGCTQQTTSCSSAPWVNDSTLPSQVYRHSSVISTLSNGSQYVYVIGGYDAIYQNSTLRAGVSSTGSLGSWITDTALPFNGGLYDHSSVISTLSNGSQYVYVIGGYNTTYQNSTLRAGVSSTGAIGAWVAGTTLPFTGGLSDHSSVISTLSNGSQYVYVIGGYNNTYQNSTLRAGVSSTGAIGAWVAGTTLPFTGGLYLHSSVVTNVSGNQYVYVIGGYNNSVREKRVWRASVGTNGALGSWTADNDLPHPSTPTLSRGISEQSSVVSGNQSIYVIGGYNNSVREKRVWRATPTEYVNSLNSLSGCSYALLYTSYCTGNQYSCSGTCPSCNSTWLCDLITCAVPGGDTLSSCAVGASNQCCDVGCETTAGCNTSNNNNNCNSVASTCVNATYKLSYAGGTCSGCGANGANGTCTSTNLICGVGSGCCSSGACTAAGASDGCCPLGATAASDADCSISFVSPTESDGAYKLQTYYYVNATFVMANSTGCKLEVGGANNTMTQALGSSTNYCYLNRTSQSEAEYTYKVYVNTTNGTGTYWGASSSRTVTLDTTKPTAFTAVSPTETNNTWLSRNYWRANFTFTETNPAGCRLEINSAQNLTPANSSSLPGGTNYCFFNTSPTDGNYWYKLYANDSAGNWNASIARNVSLDTGPPSSFTFVSPTEVDEANKSQTYYYVNVTFSDANPSACYLEVGGSNVSMTRSGTNCYLNRSSQSDGAYAYRVFANDSSNSWGASSSRTVTLDTTKPTAFTAVSPTETNNTWLSRNYWRANFTFTETNPSACRLEVNGATNVTPSTSSLTGTNNYCFFNRTSQSDGNYWYKLYANDSGGNWNASIARNVSLDTGPPSGFTFVSPTEADDAYKSQNYYYVNVTFSEANPSTCYLEVGGANVSMTRSGTNCYLNRTSQSDGSYSYLVYANDSANSWGASANRIVNLDTTKPTAFTAVSPTETNNTWLSRNYWRANFTFTETNPSGCLLEINSTTNVTPNASSLTGTNNYCFFNRTTQGDNTYWYKLYANDSANNRNASIPRNVSLDASGPTSLTYVSPTETNDAWIAKSYFTVNLTFTEQNPSVCYLEVGGANISLVINGSGSSRYCGINRTSQSDGSYSYRIFVNDSSNNAAFSSYRVVNLDATPPTGFTFVSPSDANNSNVVRNYYYVNTTFTELNSDSAACRLEVNNLNGTTTNISMTRSDTNCYVNRTSQIAKNYTYKVYANDSAGNVNASIGRQINLENYTTSGTLSSATPYSAQVGSASNYLLNITLNLTNAPSAPMSSANISYSSNLPAGWALNATKQQCNTIAKDASCARTFQVTIPAGTAPTSKTIFWKAEWIENDGSTHSPVVFNSTAINIQEQTGIWVGISEINTSINSNNTAGITQAFVNATGNSPLQNVSIYLTPSASPINITLSLKNVSNNGCVRNSATNWTCSRICGGSGCDPSFDPNNIPFNVTITVPWGTAAQNYLGTLNITSANGGYVEIPVNITVPTYATWSLSPTSTTKELGISETGLLGQVTLNNSGNVNLTFRISCNNGFDTQVEVSSGINCDNSSSTGLLVQKQSTAVANFTLTVGQSGNASFNATFYNGTATPATNYSAFTLSVSDQRPKTQYVVFSPSSTVELTNNLTITANLSDDIGIYDSLVKFQITPPGGSATNYTPTRITGSTNSSPGNFSLNYSSTSTQGTYNLTVFPIDSTGKYNASNTTFSVAGVTTVVVSSNQSSFTISGITQTAGAWFLAKINFSNTGYAKAYYANASASLPSGWSINYSNFTDNKNISLSGINQTTMNISIPAGAAALGYAPAPSLSWKQANGTSASNNTVLAVTVASNPLLRFLNYSGNYTIFQGNGNTSTVVLDSYGNINVSSINLTCSGSACTTFNITFNETSVSSLNGGLQRAINITITVPSGTTNNTYNVTIIASGGSGTNASFNASIVVPPSSGWAFTPTTLTLYRVGASSDNYSEISLWNYGNLNESITSITLNGTLSSAITLNQSSISNLAGQSSQAVWLLLNTPNSTTTYSGYLIASNGTSEQSVPITINAYQYSMAIISPTTASPTSQLSAGDNVSIVARVLLGGSPVSVNTSFNASVSNQTCSVSSYSASAGLWSITCGAPAITGSLYGDLNLTANYSLGLGWLLSSALQTSAVRYVDISPPQIGSSSLPTVDLGSGNSIQLNMTDNDAVSWTNVAVFTPSGTSIHSQNHSEANISITFTAGQLPEAGDYGVLINSTDVTSNTNNTVVYFEVLDAKVLTGTLTDATSAPLSATLKFKRPNSGEVLVQNSTDASGAYYARVGKRYYDFELALGSTSITLRNASINASTSALVSEADIVPTTAVTIPGSAPVKVYVASPAVQYSSALLNISFADSLSSLVYEGNLHLYKCGDWNYGSRLCRSSWSRVSGSSVDKATHRLSANVSSFSAYAVVENYCGDSVCRPDLGETYSSCASDCPATFNVSPNATVTEINQTVTSSVAGAASVNLQQYISQLEELRNNPQISNATREEIASLIERLKKLKDEKEISSEMLDEINRVVKKAQEELGIRLASQNIYLELYAGESTVTSAHVKNTLNADSTVTITKRGDVSRFVSFTQGSLQLKPQEESAFAVAVSIPIETAPAVYYGELTLQNERGNVSIPVNIRVMEPQEKVLDLKINPLAETVAPGQNLQVEVNLYNLGDVKRIDVQLKLQMLDQTAERTVQEYEEAISLENQLTATKTLQIPPDTPDGKYIVRAQAYYPDKFGKTREAVNIAYVFVQKPLYALTIFGVPITIIAAVAIALLLAGAYLYYTKIESERKRRYLEKIDFTKLPAPGGRSGFIGKIAESNVRAFVELDKLSTHTLAAGATGSGKTVAAQVLVEEALKKGIAVVVFDPTAQWTGFLRSQKNREMLDAYKEFNIPTSEAQAFKGNIHVVKDPSEKIEFKKLVKPGEITVFVLNKLKQTALAAPTQQANAPLAAREISIAKLGEQKTGLAEKIAQAAGPANAQKEPSEMEQFVANSIRTIFDANLEESKQLRLILVYDEVHRLLPKFGGSGLGFTQIERGVREFRKWGLGLVLVSQVLSDFIGEIKANIGTEIQMRTKYEGDLDRIKLKYGEDTMKSIVKASIGTAMVQNSEYNHGRPYFVSFRPLLHNVVRLTDAELSQYEQYNEKIERFAALVEKMKQGGIDVFDVELELGLARDKLKKGAFNIVDIYLESLQQKIRALETRALRK